MLSAKLVGESAPWHSLRHTLATRLLERGASIYDVKMMLRHKHIATTEIYEHLRVGYLRRATNLLEEESGDGG